MLVKLLLRIILVVFLLLIVGCAPAATPAPQVVRETVIVAGTPQVVERVVTATPAPTNTPTPKAQVTIRWQVSFAPVEAQQKSREYAAEFEKANPDIKVQVEYVSWEQLRQSLLTNSVASNVPDVVHASSFQSSPEMKSLGAWADLSKYMTKEWIDKHQFLDGAFNEMGAFGVPVMKVAEGIVFYNRAAFAQAGITPPPVDQAWTWDQAIAAMQKLTVDKNGDGVPEQWGWGDRAKAGFIIQKSTMPYYYSYGQDIIYQKDGKWVSGFEKPEVQEVFKLYVDLYRKYKVKDPGSLGWGLAEASRAWAGGNTAMMNIGQWFRSTLPGEYGKDWDAMLFPVKQGQAPFVLGHPVYWHISSQSKHKDEAWRLIDFLMEPERVATLGQLDTESPPMTKPALQLPYWAKNSFVLERTTRWSGLAKFMNPHPKYTAIWDSVVGPVTQDAVLGKITTDDAIKTLNTEINKQLAAP